MCVSVSGRKFSLNLNKIRDLNQISKILGTADNVLSNDNEKEKTKKEDKAGKSGGTKGFGDAFKPPAGR